MFEPRKKKRKKIETNLQTRIMKYLRHEQTAYKCALTNTPNSADAGMQDITCISPTGIYYAIELKKPLDGVQSRKQKLWQAEIIKRGGIYYIIHSLKELKSLL